MLKRSLTTPLLVAAVAATAAVALARSGADPAAPGVSAGSPPSSPLLGVVSAGREQALARIDPDTLRARTGRRVAVGPQGCASRSGGTACWSAPPWSFSPGRSHVAVARNDGGVARSLAVVDVGRMRVAADVPIEGGSVGLLAWPTRGRLLAVQEVCCDEQQQLVAVDVARRRVAARRALGGTVLGVGRTSGELVLLLAPAQDIGAARLAVADRRGSVRFMPLQRMRAGRKPLSGRDYRVEHPGIAVDPQGRRAFVVGPDLVAAVDLSSGAVSYHEPVRSTSILGRLRDWLDPAAYAKGSTGPTRSARWLGRGLIAVTGADEDRRRIRPAGLSVIDTRDWSIRTIDPRATDVRVAGDLMLATGWATGEQESIGLTAYGLDGEMRFRLFDGRQAWVEQIYDGRAYVGRVPRDGRFPPLRIVDLGTGRSVGERARVLPPLLLDRESSWWEG